MFIHSSKIGDKFLYLVWFVKGENERHRFRRAKIKLDHLSWDQLADQPISAHIRLTDAKGGPVCATLGAENISWR